MTSLNIGVLGCANIAERYVIPAILSLPEQFKLIGVASRTEDNANSFAEKFNTIPVRGYEVLLHQESLDVLYIPLPNGLHFEWIKKALEKGIHVLSEKSLACSLDEVSELTKIAKLNNLALVENFQFRFHSQLSEIKQLVKAGKIGELRAVRCAFGFPPFEDPNNIRYQKKLGGGALFDAGAYPIKMAQQFLGNEIHIAGASLFVDREKGVDIWGGGFMKTKNGSLFAEISFGFDHYYQCVLELWGSKGKLFTNRIFTAPPGYAPIVNIQTGMGDETLTLNEDDHFKNMLLHFYKLATSREGLKEELEQNILQARLIQEFREEANAK